MHRKALMNVNYVVPQIHEYYTKIHNTQKLSNKGLVISYIKILI